MSVRSPNTMDLAILLFAALGIKRTEITTEQIALLGIYVDALIKPERDAHERCAAALRGIVGLLQMVGGRDDLPPEIADILETNHRVVEAKGIIAAAIGDGP